MVTSLKKIKDGAVEIIRINELEKRLTSGGKLRIKLGADPTAPDLHLGHYIVLRKLRDFQELGHTVVFIIGDFTALIGDPSGRSKTRPSLSIEQIEENAKTYFEQVFKILDKDKTEIRFNSEWLSKISLEKWIRIASKFTIARILERDDFLTRYESGTPIFFHEFFYPVMQAYDSVAIKADVELGGTDQKFNLLMGRKLQESMNMAPQIAIIMPILRGTDGIKKMSKSLKNYIGITENPVTMFGKVMSIPDTLISEYYSLVLQKSEKESKEIDKIIQDGKENPMKLKMQLAKEIVTLFHSQEDANIAKENFKNIFSKKEMPENMEELDIAKFIQDGKANVVVMLNEKGIVKSKSDAKRLIKQGGIQINGKKLKDFKNPIPLKKGDVIKVGKLKFFRITV
ncbi:MAG: tyrosine--tRNA ligase [Caldisericaceae bacterium]|nr:tyrosine--tRNA ligase [Caldisericaceae bacterium]